ncbi:MAG: deoxyribonuclease IV [Nitrosopumilaceae archaeon]
MQVGVHVSIAASLDIAIDNATERECSAFQIFTRNPRSWNAKEISQEVEKKFKEKLSASKIDRLATVVHMPYLPNFSSPDESMYSRSLKTLIAEVERAEKLGIPYVVAHLGSHMGTGDEAGIKRLVNAFTKASKKTNGVTILLENTAGQKNSVGSNFEQLASILSQLEPAKKFGVCFDTCHAFAAGYDLRTEKATESTLGKFDAAVGFEHLKILHLNDSKGEIGSNTDRHEHIGLGHIGERGMREVIKFGSKEKIPMILETPIDDRRDDIGNLKKVKELAR